MPCNRTACCLDHDSQQRLFINACRFHNIQGHPSEDVIPKASNYVRNDLNYCVMRTKL